MIPDRVLGLVRGVALPAGVESFLAHCDKYPPAHCGNLARAWIWARTGRDVAPWAHDLDRRGWLRVVRDEPGSLDGLARRLAGDNALREVASAGARCGAVGVVSAPAGHDRLRPVFAIGDSAGRWAILKSGGGLFRSALFPSISVWVL